MIFIEWENKLTKYFHSHPNSVQFSAVQFSLYFLFLTIALPLPFISFIPFFLFPSPLELKIHKKKVFHKFENFIRILRFSDDTHNQQPKHDTKKWNFPNMHACVIFNFTTISYMWLSLQLINSVLHFSKRDPSSGSFESQSYLLLGCNFPFIHTMWKVHRFIRLSLNIHVK